MALADQLNTNEFSTTDDLVYGGGAQTASGTVPSSGTTTFKVSYTLTAQGGDGGPTGAGGNCNVSSSGPATLTFTGLPTGVSATGGTSWTACATQDVTFTVTTAASAGTYLNVTPSLSGGTGGYTIHTHADFTLVLTGPVAPGDTEGPQNASIIINDGDVWTNDTAVTVDIAATDNVDVTKYRLATTVAGLDTATDVPVTSSTDFSADDLAFTLAGPDGTNSAWVRFYDDADNYTDASDMIGLDRVDPTSVVTGFDDDDIFELGDTLPTVTCTSADDRSGVATAGTLTSSSSLAGVGTFTFSCNGAVDNAGNTQTVADTKSYKVIFRWAGFFQPVENLSAWNSSKAGQSIPVKFSLDGDQGLSIFDPTAPYSGAPRIVQIACPSSSTPDPIEEYATTTANSKLIYDGSVDQYNYVWKTLKDWAGKCFRLDVKLIDGTIHSANFKFTK